MTFSYNHWIPNGSYIDKNWVSEEPEQQLGRGHWKFNASLIAVQVQIQTWKQTFEVGADARENWEYVKFKIRQYTKSKK